MKNTIEIERLYESMSGRLYNASLRIVGCSADAEEIMHDSLLQYWRFKRKDEIRDIKGWLTSTCIRKSIDKLRERHRWKDFLEQYEVTSIQKALYTLPDHYRAILSLHLFEGYDYQEISQITGTNESTIRSLYMRGRQKLAAALKQMKS